MTKLRTIVSLTTRQYNALNLINKKTGIPRSEIIRRALEEYLKENFDWCMTLKE